MAIHNREFDDERCKNCSVNAKCLACDVYLKPTVEELEKIKKELQTPNLPGDKVVIRGDCYISLSHILHIMDKHIKEEQNGQ